MTTFYDVPTDALIEALTADLDDEGAVEEPDWAQFTKTGEGRELPPEQEDFWQRRAASVLRKVAVQEPIGVEKLRREYGSRKQGSTRYRTRPNSKTSGSGKIVRTILAQLEDAGYVEIAQGEGRRITGDGRSLLDDTAGDVLDDLNRPELEKYA